MWVLNKQYKNFYKTSWNATSFCCQKIAKRNFALRGGIMYQMSEDQLNTLMYIINHIRVTGPDQGALLSSAANVLRALRPEPEKKEAK